jgi:hypothetical protein
LSKTRIIVDSISCPVVLKTQDNGSTTLYPGGPSIGFRSLP